MKAQNPGQPIRINLLPAAYELRYQRARRMRRWVAVGVAVIAVQVAAAVTLRQMGGQARELQRGLVDAEHQQRTINARLESLGNEQEEVERQLKLTQQLNRKHRWSELLAAVTQCLPETVVLTRVETNPAKSGTVSVQSVPMRGPGGKNLPQELVDVANGLVITGVATDHDAVTAFLRNLNVRGHVGRCVPESTVRQPYLTGEGVLFTIKTKW
jgi:Tfp pilus assembly protein PilN